MIIAALALPAAVYGAEFNEELSPDSILEEIVVSGYRLTSPLGLNASLTLLNQETIQLSTLEHFEELVQMVPNMNLSGEGSRARYFQLRGIGEREQYEGAPNPSVGYIIDDIDLSGIGGVASLYDVQQIEVLRGPQSARYGSSALAGVIYMQSAPPAEQTSMNVELTAGNDGLFAVGDDVGGRRCDRSRGRRAVHDLESNGVRDNNNMDRDDTNGREELTPRGQLHWTFSHH